MDFQKILKERNEKHEYAKLLGMKMLEVNLGYAKGKIEIEPRHMNPIGSVHGGCLFSLADTVGGTAALSRGNYAATISANMNYLRPAINVKEIIAEAKEIKYGKRILVYQVDLTDENGQLLCQGTFSFFNLGRPVE